MSNFEEAKTQADRFWNEASDAGKALNEFLDKHPKGPMGLTPDFVRAMSEFKALKSAYDVAASKSRAFNARYVKEFSKEIRAERAARFAI